MDEYKEILVPVDGSPLSDLAFEKALSLIELTKGEVTVVYVSDAAKTDMIETLNDFDERRMQAAEKLIERYKDKAENAGSKIKTMVQKGHAAEEIIILSKKFDLIVMGNKGRGAISSFLIGSVAEKVIRHAVCPVLLIKENKKVK